MVKAKVGKYEVEMAVKKAMEEVGIPVTSAYVEKTVGLNYRTVIKNFEEMRKRGLVKKILTTGNSFFVLSDWVPIDADERSKDVNDSERSNDS